MKPAGPMPLPELRQELRLERGADTATGAPTWLVIDPVSNRYIQIDGTAFQVLSMWSPEMTGEALAQAVSERFGLAVDKGQIEDLAQFLEANRLTVEPRLGGWKPYADVARAQDHGWIKWAIHNYLYVKMPLLKPQRFLDRTAPLTAVFFTRGFWLAIAATGLAGLYLVSRQWDAFTSTFLHLFSWEGAVIYGLALIVVKSLHELGHAYTATRYAVPPAFRAAIRTALAAPLDGPLAARFIAPLVTALVGYADEGEELEVALAETIAALEQVGVPRGRQYVLLAGDAAPLVATARAGALRTTLAVPVLLHDASLRGFVAGRLPDGAALELDDELREAEAIVVLASIEGARGGPWRAASLLCPGACTLATRQAVAAATSGDTSAAWAWVQAAEREAPIDLMLSWDAHGRAESASGRAALAAWASADARKRGIH